MGKRKKALFIGGTGTISMAIVRQLSDMHGNCPFPDNEPAGGRDSAS